MPEFRPARAADVQSLHGMCQAFTPSLTGSLEDFSLNFRVLVADPAWLIVVAAEGEELLGYAAAQNYGRGLRGDFSTGRLHDLFVQETARKAGVGRGLMRLASEWAQSIKPPMVLDWQATQSAVTFYESLGLEPDFEGDYSSHPGFCLDLRAVSRINPKTTER